MPQEFVHIVNRGKYTNPRKAEHYVRRGLAREYFVSLNRHVLEIWMLEEAELAIARSEINRRARGREEKFDWYVGESGGSPLMQALQGVGGGIRLWNARFGKPEEETEPQPA